MNLFVNLTDDYGLMFETNKKMKTKVWRGFCLEIFFKTINSFLSQEEKTQWINVQQIPINDELSDHRKYVHWHLLIVAS